MKPISDASFEVFTVAIFQVENLSISYNNTASQPRRHRL